MRTLTLRRKAADDYRFLGLDYCDVDTSDFADYIAAMDERYKCAHEQTEKMREFKFLDSVRHPEYPDIVLVMLFKEGMQAEKVWVHCMAFSENELFGKLPLLRLQICAGQQSHRQCRNKKQGKYSFFHKNQPDFLCNIESLVCFLKIILLSSKRPGNIFP